MSGEEVIADFSAKLLTDDIDQLKPVKGRVLLNRDQLVLVTGEGKEVILLSHIASTDPGSVADRISQFFEEAIAIAYDREGTQKRAVIGGSAETITKFRTLLFKLRQTRRTANRSTGIEDGAGNQRGFYFIVERRQDGGNSRRSRNRVRT